MKVHQFDFGTLTELEPQIIEVTVRPAIEVNLHMLKRVYRLLEDVIEQPCAFLVNKQHDYSLSLDAMRHLGNHPLIASIGFLLHRESTERIVQLEQQLMINRELPTRAFWDRDAAMSWLRDSLPVPA